MEMIALLIYGSHARNEAQEGSDIDLLAITNGDRYEIFEAGIVNLSCYPLPLLISRAKAGDLFVSHLICEAIAICDDRHCLDLLKQNFRRKENYTREIRQAADIGWMLIDCQKFAVNQVLVNRRIAWCVRTILIAKSVVEGCPAFSKTALANSSDAPHIENLIEIKDSLVADSASLSFLTKFLSFLSLFSPPVHDRLSPLSYRNYFLQDENEYGVATVDSLETGDLGRPYMC